MTSPWKSGNDWVGDWIGPVEVSSVVVTGLDGRAPILRGRGPYILGPEGVLYIGALSGSVERRERG